MIEFSNNLAFNNVPAKKMLEELTGKTCYFENDANAAALGEAYAGAGNGAQNFVAVTLGTGVGSGIIVDGKIVSGMNFTGGEMGHTVIVVDGIPCNCGRNRSYCSDKGKNERLPRQQDVGALRRRYQQSQRQNCIQRNVCGR